MTASVGDTGDYVDSQMQLPGAPAPTSVWVKAAR